MVLSGMVHALREQNWLSVAIEVLIVVVGIVLALQFDNWNDDRKERGLEQIYLSRLAADIQGDIEGFEDLRRVFVEKSAFIKELKGKTDSARIKNDPEEWMQRLRYSLYVSLPTVRTATIDELAGSGRLAIIQDLELRAELANYYAQYSLISKIYAQPVGDYKALVYETLGLSLYDWQISQAITAPESILEGNDALQSREGFQAAANAEVGYAGDLIRYCDQFIRMGESLETRIDASITI